MATIRIQKEDFDIGRELANIRAGNPKIGAIASFVGLVRDLNDDSRVTSMTLEHYPGMTEKALQAIADEARTRWQILDYAIVHRVGALRPTDQIVLVIIASGHRGNAFAACEFIMDYLKTRAPLWKKEQTQEGERWVEARDSDNGAASRWSVHAAQHRKQKS